MSGAVDYSSLLLLLSIDIVGSAAFKARQAQFVEGQQPPWVRAFETFYRDIPPRLQQEVITTFADQGEGPPPVQLWKAIGDQLVFLARPQSAAALEGLCLALLRALRAANAQMEQQCGFALHGAAWAFAEGGANVSFRFDNQQLGGSTGFDLIGPDVDLGFRLVGLAPEAQVLVPYELRGLLPQPGRLRLELIGEAPLKGIRPEPYPLLTLIEV